MVLLEGLQLPEGRKTHLCLAPVTGLSEMLGIFGPRDKITLFKNHLDSVLKACMFICLELLGDLSTATWN